MSALPRVQPEDDPPNAGAQHCTTYQLVAGSEAGADLAAGPCHGGSNADSATASDAQAPPSGSTLANRESDTTGSQKYRPPSLVEEDSVSEMASVSLPTLSDCECTTDPAKSKPDKDKDVDAEAVLVPNLREMLLVAPQKVSELQAAVHSADASLSGPPEASVPAAAPPAQAESANRGCKRRTGLPVPDEEVATSSRYQEQEMISPRDNVAVAEASLPAAATSEASVPTAATPSKDHEEEDMDMVSPPLSLNSAPTIIGQQSDPEEAQASKKRKVLLDFNKIQADL